MKTFKIVIAILVTSIIIISCSKDDPAPTPVQPVVIAPEQNPLPGYLIATGLSQITPNVNSSDYEMGFSFIPLVNGKITAVVVKIPDARLAMRVTFWDKTTATPIRTQTFNFPTAGVELTQPISPLDLVKDKEYMISFNTNDWYEHKKPTGNAVYPVTVGDIKITGYSFIIGTAQVMPTISPTTIYEGDCSFKFQK